MYKTWKDLARAIPDSWKDVNVAVAEDNWKGEPLKILHVSLHRNSDGTRIILIHSKRTSTWDDVKKEIK